MVEQEERVEWRAGREGRVAPRVATAENRVAGSSRAEAARPLDRCDQYEKPALGHTNLAKQCHVSHAPALDANI